MRKCPGLVFLFDNMLFRNIQGLQCLKLGHAWDIFTPKIGHFLIMWVDIQQAALPSSSCKSAGAYKLPNIQIWSNLSFSRCSCSQFDKVLAKSLCKDKIELVLTSSYRNWIDKYIPCLQIRNIYEIQVMKREPEFCNTNILLLETYPPGLKFISYTDSLVSL